MFALILRLARSLHTSTALSAPFPNAVLAGRELVKWLNITTFAACFCFLKHWLDQAPAQKSCRGKFRHEHILARPQVSELGVRRAKVAFFSGCKSHPATIAPAGTNRSSHGGNEVAEASGVEGHELVRRDFRCGVTTGSR